MTKVFTNGSIFNGEIFIGNKAVVVEGGRVKALVPKSQISGYGEVIDLEGQLLVPGFIDLQVNGGGGAFYTQKADAKNYKIVNEAHREFGTTALLPTLVSTSMQNILAQIEVTKQLMQDPANGVLGLHVEGPYFNPDKKGAHSLDFIRQSTDEEIELLIQHGVGVIKILTLAPEMVSEKHIRKLVDAGIPVSAGHSNSSYEEAMNGFAYGISKVTHLYNAMSQFTSRSPGLVGAFFDSDDEVFGGIIVDGVHCDYAAVRIAQKLKRGKLFLVSDASFVKQPVGTFEIDEFKISFRDGKYLTESGNLAGSAISMLDSVQNSFLHADIELAETLKMASRYPAEFLKMDHEYGFIKENYFADFVVLERDTLKLKAVYKCGDPVAIDAGISASE